MDVTTKSKETDCQASPFKDTWVYLPFHPYRTIQDQLQRIFEDPEQRPIDMIGVCGIEISDGSPYIDWDPSSSADRHMSRFKFILGFEPKFQGHAKKYIQEYCVPVSEPKPGDIVLYPDIELNIVHIGIVKEVTEEGQVIVISKWDTNAPPFSHPVDIVPASLTNPDNVVFYYRMVRNPNQLGHTNNRGSTIPNITG